MDAALALTYTTKNDEETVCHFCENNCKRTFIDAQRPDGSSSRYISGFSCEKGTVENHDAMLSLVKERKKIAAAFPNLVDYEAARAFQHTYDGEPMPPRGSPITTNVVEKGWLRIKRKTVTRPFERSSQESWDA